jgi:excisionase family DNA binding protein
VTIDDIRTGPPTLDVATAGRLLGISRSYAFELARRGEFPCRLLRVGSRYRVPRTALVALLEGSPTGETA